MKPSFFTTLLLPLASACALHARQTDPNISLPYAITKGNDTQADPATKGYFINHVSLIVSNITASREWYSSVLGLRHIFTVDASSHFSIMYMGHPQGGRNGTGWQEGREMLREKNNLAGLVELVEYKRSTNRTYTPNPRTTFSHLGLIVPDMDAAQSRFEALGVTIVKKRGVLDFSPETGNRVLAAAYGFGDLDSEETQRDIEAVMPGLLAIGFKELFLIADLDGNLLEVQPQVE